MLKRIYKLIIGKLPLSYRIFLQYFRVFRCFPNIKNPMSLNEKILKRILCEKDPAFAFYSDKYAVREYIAKTLDKKYLIPLIAVYDKSSDLENLNKWENIVIKPNHGAGMVEIIDNEPEYNDKIIIMKKAQKWLELDFSKVCDEWHYSLIKPKLVVEQKITDMNESLRDYKFHRFLQKDGTYKQILQVVAERSNHGYETVFFDILDLSKILHSPFDYKLILSLKEKEAIGHIVELNSKICPEYNYVRLDWYITKDQIYFGEITFTPGAGRSKSFAGKFGLKMGGLWYE